MSESNSDDGRTFPGDDVKIPQAATARLGRSRKQRIVALLRRPRRSSAMKASTTHHASFESIRLGASAQELAASALTWTPRR